MTNEAIYRKRITWLLITSLAPIFAFAPALIGIAGSSLIPGCNESNCGLGVLPWATFMTAPIGFVAFIFGLIMFLISLKNKISKAVEQTPREKKLKRYYFAWMATALSPLVLGVSVIIFFTLVFASLCNETACNPTFQGAEFQIYFSLGTLVVVAPWLHLGGLWIWNKFKK
jgi:uncharacterized BrkB/YihY/UPF0761 family membrane protein